MSDTVEEDNTPWVKIRVTLPGSRKVLRLKKLLDLNSRHEALGIAVELFAQTYLNVWKDGDWSRWKVEELEEKIGWRGEEGQLTKALQESGFLDGMKVHNWEKQQWRLIDKRMRRETRSGGFRRNGGPIEEDTNSLRQRTRMVLEAREKRG